MALMARRCADLRLENVLLPSLGKSMGILRVASPLAYMLLRIVWQPP